MKLKDFDFNSILGAHLCIMEDGATVLNKEKCFEELSIGATLRKLPAEWAEREIKETRWFIDQFVIVVEKGEENEK